MRKKSSYRDKQCGEWGCNLKVVREGLNENTLSNDLKELREVSIPQDVYRSTG